MQMVSSTKKGDAFESTIFDVLAGEIAAGRFYITQEFCQIFKKKGYHSRDRNQDIVFDVSIEVSLPGQLTYSILILIECKDLSRPVTIDDAEEFFAKVDQVSGKNIKGVIASANSFSNTTIAFSRSKGFGLLRYFDSSNFKWILPRSPSSLVTSQFAHAEWSEAMHGVATESYRPRYFDFYAYYDAVYTTSLRSFFMGLLGWKGDDEVAGDFSSIVNPPNDDRQVVPFLGKHEIEAAAAKTLREIEYCTGPVSLDDICRRLEATSGLELSYENDRYSTVLGEIRFNPLKITIFRGADKSETRERFTLAHEISHFLLGHSDYMAGEYCEEQDIDFEAPKDLGIKDLIRMEWQANALASALLLPREMFVRDFLNVARTLDLRDRGFGLIYLDSQRVNIEAFRAVAHFLGTKYNVSRAAIKIRLKKLGFLNEG